MVKLPKLKIPHINIKLVTKVLIGAAIIGGLGGLTVATVQHYQSKQTIKTNQRNAELKDAYQRGYEKGSKETTVLRTQNALWKLECQKGLKAYGTLSTFQKRTVPAPACEQPALQPQTAQ